MRSIDAAASNPGRTHLGQLLLFCWLSLGGANGTLAQELLLLSFSEGAPAAGSYSTREPITLSVTDGQEVMLARASGRDYQLEASDADWTWTQVQQLPRNSSSLKVTPQRRDQDVLLQISYVSKDGDDSLSYTSTVAGKLGEWIPLSSSQRPADSTGRRYSTAARANNLAVKVELAAP